MKVLIGVEPVAYIHRNDYDEYRLEPLDSFKIKSIPRNTDILLYPTPPDQAARIAQLEAEKAELLEALNGLYKTPTGYSEVRNKVIANAELIIEKYAVK